MDDLRKINGALGNTITELNTNTTDEEVAKFMKITLGDVIKAVNRIPERCRDITMNDLIDLAIGVYSEEDIDEDELMKKLFHIDETVSEEELEQIGKDLADFFRVLDLLNDGDADS